MKKLLIFTFVFVLFGCKVGEFPEERNKLHEANGYNICDKEPDRCVNGVPW